MRSLTEAPDTGRMVRMRILVTGGAGFIGSHITDRYLADGHDVAVIDDLSTGRVENVNPQVQFCRLDIADLEPLEEVFARLRPQVVNHHAAQLDVRKSVADPLFDARVNIIGSLNLLEMARRYGTRRFIFSSSGGCVYGESQNLPTSESEKRNPLSPYGVAKVTVEHYLESYRAIFGLDYVVLRYSNVYGPRQDSKGEAGVIAIFVGRIMEGKPCIIYGDGRQTRDYVFIGDVVQANVRAILGKTGVYNIGTGKETSVNGLVDILESVTKHKVERVYEKPRPGELLRNCLAVGRARSLLEWQPGTPLERGIKLTFQYFQSRSA